MSRATEWRFALLLQLIAIACAFNAEAAAQRAAAEYDDAVDIVSIDAPAQMRLGIVVTPLTTDRYRPGVRAIATAVDIAPWLQLRADTAVADSAALASSAQLQRIGQLVAADRSASAQEYEAAQMQFSQDRARARLMHNQLQAAWGGALVASHNEQLALSLAGGAQALVRVEPMQVFVGEPEWTLVDWARLADAQPSEPIRAWRAPTSSNNGQTAAWFVVVATSQRWPSGLRTEVQLPLSKDAMLGTTVPSSAVVMRGGETWAFVQLDATHFQRRLLDPTRPVPSGYFVTGHFMHGDAVVVSGAGLLLAELVGTAAADED